jgi:predicted RNA-binding protein YlqC (UPF0109 family)
MTDSGSNPFAEPDFSSLHTSGAEDAVEEDYDEEDEEDEDGAEDLEDDFDEGDEDEDAEDEEELEALDQLAAEDAEAGAHLEAEEGNRVAGGTARSVLEHVARSIVDDPEGVAVEVSETRSGIHLALHVAQSDMGRIIGRRGRTAQALRTLVRAAAARDSQEASVDIVD